MRKPLLFFTFLIFSYYYSQCNSFGGCNPNNGLYSGNNPEDIEYDNLIVGYHTSLFKDVFNNYKIWGELAAANGTDNLLTPQYINAANYPGLTGTILKATIGSAGYIQLFVLTTDGLFVSGRPGKVIPESVKSTSEFGRLTVNGKADGLPPGVFPADVKMIFATTESLTITTCTGNVYVLSKNSAARGNGQSGSETEWAQVMENATTPLTDIIVSRGQFNIGFALKKDGSIWTWGINANLGDDINYRKTLDYATKMVLPSTITSGVKMIQTTTSGTYPSYYLLDQSNTLYCLGYNRENQLGSAVEFPRDSSPWQTIWMTAKYPGGKIMNDIAWVSANEIDYSTSAVSVLNKNGQLYNAGSNAFYMLGRDVDGEKYYFGTPNGIKSTDVITSSETGAHCSAVIKKGTDHYGYVGHRVNGSMGNSDANTAVEQSFNFTITPEVYVCGLSCPDPLIENNAPVCIGNDASFTINSTPNDEITYSINNEPDQTVIMDASGKFNIIIPMPDKDQTLKIKKMKNLICGDKNLNISSITTTIDNSNIQIEEIGNNSINAIILGGTPNYEYQLLDEDGNIVFPWQNSSTFTNLSSHYYQIQVKTEATDCVSMYDFIFLNLPNVITPNGDGINDTLNLSFLTKTTNASLDIFDRYGKKMLSLSNKTLYQDYKNFISGTYWYLFSDDKGIKKTGWILIKNK